MSILLNLSNKNKKSLFFLPNGAVLYITTRLRSIAGYWTIQLHSESNIELTDEVPLIQCGSLFGELPDVTREYGVFSVVDNEDNFELHESLGNKIQLFWG